MIFSFDEYELDAERVQLRRSGKSVRVDSSALRMLAVLLSRPGEVISKGELVREVWPGRDVSDRLLTVAMTRLRKALVPGRGGSEFVTTIYGEGYRFERPVAARSTPLATRASDASGFGSHAEPRASTPFVGRDRLVARLHEALDEARSGRGRVCVLMGEPGIGKTRAMEMLEQELAASGVRVAWGFCREAGETPPLWPWQELLRQLTDDPDALARLVGAGALETRRSVFEAAPSEATLRAADAAGASLARYQAFDNILAALMRATEQTPWLLVLDDLHRADAASLELLGHLVDRVARTHILLVASLRPAEQGGSLRAETPLPRILGHRNCERIVLERLKPADVASYVAAFVDDPAGEFALAIHAKSEGNPFFMTELVRQLSDAHDLSPEQLAVSAAALDLVRQRVAQVDQAARGLLSTCAVIGRNFDLGLLAEVTGSDPATLVQVLEAAVRAEVVLRSHQATIAFSFSHELIRAALYEALAPAERRTLHRHVGEALARLRASGSPVAPSDLAYHFHAALPTGDLRQTVRFCREAAAAAAAVFGAPDVGRYTQHALEALQLMERPSLKLRMSLMYQTAIYSRPHDGTAFAACVTALMRLAHEQRDGEMLARAGALVDAHFGLPPVAREVRACMEHALELLPVESPGLRAIALAGLAAAAPHCYRAEACAALCDEAVQLARAASSRGAIYMALLHQLHVRGGPLHETQADEIAAQLEHMVQRNPAELAGLLVDLALFRASRALGRGVTAAARTALERAQSYARQLRHGELTWHSERLSALLAAELGAGPQAWDMLEALHLRAQRQGIAGTALFCAYDRAVLFDRNPRPEAARVDDGLYAALRYDAEDAPMFWAVKLRALASAGFASEARAALRMLAPEQLAQLPVDSQYLGTLGHLTRAALMLAESEYCAALQPLLARYPDHFAAHLFGACDGAVPQLLGMLAHHAGETALALMHFERALELNRHAGLLLRSAETSLGLAACLLQLGESGHVQRAVGLARSVRTSASRLGMLQLGRTATAILLQARAE